MIVQYINLAYSRDTRFTPRPSYAYDATVSGALRGRTLSARTVYDIVVVHRAIPQDDAAAIRDHYRDHQADDIAINYAGHGYLMRYQGPPDVVGINDGHATVTVRFIGHRDTDPGLWPVTAAELWDAMQGMYGDTPESGPTDDGAAPAASAVAYYPAPYSHDSAVNPRPAWEFDPMADGGPGARRDSTRDLYDVTLSHPYLTSAQTEALLRHYQDYQRRTIRFAHRGQVYDLHYLGEPEVVSRGPRRDVTVRLIGTRIATGLAREAMEDAMQALYDDVEASQQ